MAALVLLVISAVFDAIDLEYTFVIELEALSWAKSYLVTGFSTF